MGIKEALSSMIANYKKSIKVARKKPPKWSCIQCYQLKGKWLMVAKDRRTGRVMYHIPVDLGFGDARR